MDDEYFTIPFVTDTTPNLPAGHQIPTQAKQNVRIISINGEYPIKSQGVLDELNCYQTTRGKYKVKISIFRRKSYQRKYIEDIHSRFDQVRPLVYHLEVFCHINISRQITLGKL